MKTKQKIGVLVIVILLVLLIGLLIYFNVSSKKNLEQVQTYFENKDGVAAKADILSNQEKQTIQIQKKLDDSSCTFDNPCVIVNPYEISPLTALIIFRTSDKTEISVSINGLKVTTMEESTLHSIPIYGLKAGIENKVLLEYGSHQKEVTIDRRDVSHSSLSVIKSNSNANINSSLYFLSSPMGTGAGAYDGEGNIVWYLTENFTLDIEFLKNGRMYLSNGGSSGVSESYDGFYEVDYLGKIHKNYSLSNGYHHELISLSDGTVIVAGGNSSADAPYIASYVYQVDITNGNIIRSFDVYDLFKKIDATFADSIKGSNVLINSIYYDEDTKEMILSLRGVNTVISLNFETQEINWIFGGEDFYPSSFNPYMLHLTNGRYPKGQHTAFLTEDGYLGLFNNDFDMQDTTSPYLDYYKNNYSSAVLYKINGKNISTYWEYDAHKQYFTYALGSFEYYQDHSKLINFGWAFKAEAFNKNATLYDFDNTYARIMELDKNDKVVFEAINDLGVYRTYKHALYEEKTANYMDYDFKLINNNPVSSLEKIQTSEIFDLLDHAILNPYELELTTNTITFNVLFDNSEVVDIYFVSEGQDTYVLHYKKKDEMASPTVNLRLKGNYAVYFDINGQFYDTNKILSFN